MTNAGQLAFTAAYTAKAAFEHTCETATLMAILDGYRGFLWVFLKVADDQARADFARYAYGVEPQNSGTLDICVRRTLPDWNMEGAIRMGTMIEINEECVSRMLSQSMAAHTGAQS